MNSNTMHFYSFTFKAVFKDKTPQHGRVLYQNVHPATLDDFKKHVEDLYIGHVPYKDIVILEWKEIIETTYNNLKNLV